MRKLNRCDFDDLMAKKVDFVLGFQEIKMPVQDATSTRMQTQEGCYVSGEGLDCEDLELNLIPVCSVCGEVCMRSICSP